MSDTLLLSRLCAICHVQPRKYTCPRCGLQSCSLVCVKRHKLRSQCSGIRDPAKYYKRSELSTPLAFDQDFNFITGVERSFEQADRNTDRLGVQLFNDGRLQKGEARLLAAIESSGAIVHKAPSGMSRNRENITRWHPKKKCISWTVEWILPESRHLARVSETNSVQNAYSEQFSQQPQNLGKRKFDESQKTHKKESENQIELGIAHSISQDAPLKEPNSQTRNHESRTFFYLHRPLVVTKAKALISLDPSATLAAAIKGRVLLEFPSIYALSYPPDNLPADYDLHTGGQETTLSHEAPSAPLIETKDAHEETAPSLDPVKVAEMIQQDLTS